jgi:CHAT domain-containing protein
VVRPRGLEELALVGKDIDALQDPRVALKALLNLANKHSTDGRLSEAAQVADRLGVESRRFGWVEGEAMSNWLLADVHTALHRPELAAVHLRRAYDGLLAAANIRWAALALGDLAGAEIAQGKIAEGLQLQQRALEVAGDRLASYWQANLLASVVPALLSAGRIDDASRLTSESLRTRKNPPYSIYLVDAQVRLARGDAAGALSLVTSPDVTSSLGGEGAAYQWPTQALVGAALRALGRRGEAEEQLRYAIDLIEERRATLPVNPLGRVSFFTDKIQPYRELLTLLLDEQRPRDAFAIAERMKGQGLQLALEQGYVDLSSTMDGAEQARERALDESLSKLNGQLLAAGGAEAAALRAQRDEARRQLDLFRSELFLRHPGVAARRVPETEPLTAAAQAIPPGSSALEMVVLEHETIAFVLKRQGADVVVDAVRLPIARIDLERRVSALANAIERRDPAATGQAAQLSQRLLAPLWRYMDGVSALAVVPDGGLWQLPWEVLPDPEHGLLVERMAVFRVPSLQILARSRQSTPATPIGGPSSSRLLALGDPLIAATTNGKVRALERDAALGPLPEAADEVRAIGRLYGPESSEVLIGSDASEEQFKRDAPRFDVLHLATHGIADGGAPMFSALALAPGSKDEDGMLEAREIAELRLHARLAVLSACDTARGQFDAGEGVIGLSWAFMAAGVPTLVVSAWKADSAATEQLMVEFHRELLTKLPVAEALRRAMIKLRQNPRYSHPYYWAPFVAVGDGW